jgi:hypothetical protein
VALLSVRVREMQVIREVIVGYFVTVCYQSIMRWFSLYVTSPICLLIPVQKQQRCPLGHCEVERHCLCRMGLCNIHYMSLRVSHGQHLSRQQTLILVSVGCGLLTPHAIMTGYERSVDTMTDSKIVPGLFKLRDKLYFDDSQPSLSQQ